MDNQKIDKLGKNIEYLDVQYCEIPELSDLYKLHTLKLASTFVKQIPETVQILNLRNVNNLDITKLNLKELILNNCKNILIPNIIPELFLKRY